MEVTLKRSERRVLRCRRQKEIKKKLFLHGLCGLSFAEKEKKIQNFFKDILELGQNKLI